MTRTLILLIPLALFACTADTSTPANTPIGAWASVTPDGTPEGTTTYVELHADKTCRTAVRADVLFCSTRCSWIEVEGGKKIAIDASVASLGARTVTFEGGAMRLDDMLFHREAYPSDCK